MTQIRSWWLALAAAALLAGCGGDDGPPTSKGSFTAVVSFGDSLSDMGTYAPATSLTGNGAAPYFGGRFSTNSSTATVWVENLARSLGVTVTPAEVGFGGQSVKCPAAATAALAGTCTGYGQGGSRVSDANGIGRPGGALTVPVKTQIANHLARFGSFKDSDLILVLAGNNDGFVQMAQFGAAAAQIQADAVAGRITASQVGCRTAGDPVVGRIAPAAAHDSRPHIENRKRTCRRWLVPTGLAVHDKGALYRHT
jgi:phospholipase/lecithinase/hemolysin